MGLCIIITAEGEIVSAGRATGLGAGPPTLGGETRRLRVAFCQRGPGTIRADRPVGSVSVAQLVHQTPVASAQANLLAAVVQAAGPRAECGTCQQNGIRSDDREPTGFDDRPFRESKVHAAGDPPPRQVDAHRHLVVQFDPLGLGRGVGRMVLNLVESDHAVRRGSARQAGHEEQQNRDGRQPRAQTRHPDAETTVPATGSVLPQPADHFRYGNSPPPNQAHGPVIARVMPGS